LVFGHETVPFKFCLISDAVYLSWLKTAWGEWTMPFRHSLQQRLILATVSSFLRKMPNPVRVIARLVIALCLLVQPATGADGVTATESTASTDFKELAKSIFRPDVTGVTIDGVAFTGDARAIGTYVATGTFFGGLPRSGGVMSSGKVVDVQQGSIPNTLFQTAGDANLSKVLEDIGLTTATYDAAVLVVDITVPKAVDIDIAYVFGSREYLYGISLQYFDVFGLFHGGGNVARIGNGKDPVSVKTVNCGTTRTTPTRNCDQFVVNQPNPIGTSLRGYTKTQIATLKLPVGTNQVKIAIADAEGPYDDSAVFLSFLSLTPTRSPTQKPTHSPTMKPTRSPTRKPTISPTLKPTQSPTLKPSRSPTMKPTQSPTMGPTGMPTMSPTSIPTRKPTMKPTQKPVLPPVKFVVPSPPPVKGKMEMMGMIGKMT
jgi:hypothetical protein